MSTSTSLTKVARTLLVTVLVMFVRASGDDGGSFQTGSSTDELLRGEQVYRANCEICHGGSGNGRGMAAHMLRTQPRDLSAGLFKFRTTPSGSLPSDDDLMKIITEGVRWTAMVGRTDLPLSERRAVVQYVKTFSSRFANEKAPRTITVSTPPPRSQNLIAQGRRLYQESECAKCHGERGDGRGIGGAELTDDRDWPMLASDLTWRPLKRGSASQDIYLTLATGLNGTPMPSFAAALSPQQRWALVFYLDTLVPKAQNLSTGQLLGEEPRGWMILRMHGIGGHGMMR